MREATERHKIPLLCHAAADGLAQKGCRYWFRISASEFAAGTSAFLNGVIKPKTIGIAMT